MLLVDFNTVIDWFYKSLMILNTSKCRYVCTLHVDDNIVVNNNEELEISGVRLYRKFSFHRHIKNICRQAGQNLSAFNISIFGQ